MVGVVLRHPVQKPYLQFPQEHPPTANSTPQVTPNHSPSTSISPTITPQEQKNQYDKLSSDSKCKVEAILLLMNSSMNCQ